MSRFHDEFADITGPIVEDEFGDMSLEDIQGELMEMQELAESGGHIDEKRFDLLLEAQENHPEFRALMEEERQNWIESVSEFVENCLERTRSFIPVNVFDSTADDLVGLGLSYELAKRIMQRQCLWLVRMSRDEISRLHESDVLGRFNSLQQNLDIIETAAIYASLPDDFLNDNRGKKVEWKKSVEDNLRQMLLDNDNDDLPIARIRNPAYEGKQYGPIKDVTSTREVEIVKSDQAFVPKRSFLDLCPSNSVMSRMTRSLRKHPSNHSDLSSRSLDRSMSSSYYQSNGLKTVGSIQAMNGHQLSSQHSIPRLPSTHMMPKRSLSREGSVSNPASPTSSTVNPALVITTASAATTPSHAAAATNGNSQPLSPQARGNIAWRASVNNDGTPATVIELDECGDFEDD